MKFKVMKNYKFQGNYSTYDQNDLCGGIYDQSFAHCIAYLYLACKPLFYSNYHVENITPLHIIQGEIELKQNQVYGVSRSKEGIKMKQNAVYGIRTAPQATDKNEYDYVDTH